MPETYNFKWVAKREEGEFYEMFDHCTASNLTEASKIIAQKNDISIFELELDEDF